MSKFFLALCLASVSVAVAAGDALDSAFLRPPLQARLHCYWWWLNGNTDQPTITRDLEQMAAKGYGGAILIDANGSDQFHNNGVPAGPLFGSPEWRKLYVHAVHEAARLHLELSLTIQSGWNLGGPNVKPENASKILTFSQLTVDPSSTDISLPQPPSKNGFYRDIATLAYPLHARGPHRPIQQLQEKAAFKEFGRSMPVTTALLEDVAPQPGETDYESNELVDLTSKIAPDGRIQWKPPTRQWEILRIGYTDSGARVSTSSGAWQGLAIDHLDHEAFDIYWSQNVVPLLTAVKPYLGKSLRYLVTDSWELGGTNWSARFRDEFRRRRGYDLLSFLPVVAGRIADDRDTSNRFLNDFRRTIGDLVRDEHYAAFAQHAKAFGLGIHPESGGPHGAPLDGMETLGISTFPQTEFWARSATHRSTDPDRYFVKEASSVAHTYGRAIVAGEGLTSIGPQWEESIWNNLKPSFDQAVCAGLNLLFWHTFTSIPPQFGVPGREYFAGTHMNPNVTWWDYAGPFFAYINRTQSMLQQGTPVSDVLYYYGDRVPNFVQLKAADPARALPGYDYDVLDETTLLHGTSVTGGHLLLRSGAAYRVLAIDETAVISLPALRQIERLVAAGAVVAGRKPLRTTGLTRGHIDDSEVKAIADRLWADCPGPHRYRQGQVFCRQPARDVLAAIKVQPDFAYPNMTADHPAFDYIHRATTNADVYFIRNTGEGAATSEFTLRPSSAAKNRVVELWHPDSGTRYTESSARTSAAGSIQVPLTFEPYGSVLVVLRSGDTRFPDQPHQQLVPARTIDGPWALRFPPKWGAPAEITLPELRSWSENQDAGVRFYSGHATYSKSFSLDQEFINSHKSLHLDLGAVHEIAKVALNGHDLGILWKRPFVVDIHAAAQPGNNQLEITIVNLWPNRLIGDQSLPVDQRFTKTNITKYRSDSPLLPSGLLGPVRLLTE